MKQSPLLADLLSALLQHHRHELKACGHVYNTARLVFGRVLHYHICQLLRVCIVDRCGEHATIALVSTNTMLRYLTADALMIAARRDG